MVFFFFGFGKNSTLKNKTLNIVYLKIQSTPPDKMKTITTELCTTTVTYWMTKISLRLKKNEEYLEVKIRYLFSTQTHWIIFCYYKNMSIKYLELHPTPGHLSGIHISVRHFLSGFMYFCHCLQNSLGEK